MNPLSLQTPCPCCQNTMQPASLHCASCAVRIEGRIETNEFAALPPEELHLLRIFVWAEGRVRDMEGPLGLSYPTIRTRLASLKEKLRLDQPASSPANTSPAATAPTQPANPGPAADPVEATLAALEAGTLEFHQALELIKKQKGRK